MIFQNPLTPTSRALYKLAKKEESLGGEVQFLSLFYLEKLCGAFYAKGTIQFCLIVILVRAPSNATKKRNQGEDIDHPPCILLIQPQNSVTIKPCLVKICSLYIISYQQSNLQYD